MIEITHPDQFDELFKTNEDYYEFASPRVSVRLEAAPDDVDTAASDVQVQHANSFSILKSQFVSFVKSVYQGISRKYSQLYAAEHCARILPERFSLRSMLSSCMTKASEITEYFSPDKLHFVVHPMLLVAVASTNWR